MIPHESSLTGDFLGLWDGLDAWYALPAEQKTLDALDNQSLHMRRLFNYTSYISDIDLILGSITELRLITTIGAGDSQDAAAAQAAECVGFELVGSFEEENRKVYRFRVRPGTRQNQLVWVSDWLIVHFADSFVATEPVYSGIAHGEGIGGSI